MQGFSDNSRGSAFIVTLLMTALITAAIVEFAYSVYVGTNILYNYRDAKRLSVLADSAIYIALDYIKEYLSKMKYTNLQSVSIPLAKEDSPEALTVTIIDECAKFNINTIINENGSRNDIAFNGLLRLLKHLGIDQRAASLIAQHIAPNSTKKHPLYTPDALYRIKAIAPEDIKKLLPFITVYGNGLININTAPEAVLIALSEEIDKELAGRIICYRDNAPFTQTADMQKVTGMEGITKTLLGRISIRSTAFTVQARASYNSLSREINTAVVFESKSAAIKYWKEL
ncbi:MAG: general secretion pathway protein GspK [Nitrospirae bacterium]|nr:general secretion pathway protein GspK [Nitrospirota bacterium]